MGDEIKKNIESTPPAEKQEQVSVGSDQNIVIKRDELPTLITKTEVERMIGDVSAKTDDKLKKFEERLVTDKTSLMTVFGIFASVVTFLSVEIQIFKNICDPLKLVGFTFVLLGSLLSFILILHWIANFWLDKKEIKFPTGPTIFILVLFVIGIFSFQVGRDEVSCKENMIFERYSNDFNVRQLELEEKIDTRINQEVKAFEVLNGQKFIDLEKQLQNLPKQ